MRFVASVVILVLCAVLCSTVYGGEPPIVVEPVIDTGGLEVFGLASNDLIAVRPMYFTGGRIRVGADIAWMDGLESDEAEGWRTSFAATYDLMQQQDFQALLIKVPATLYVGGLGGVLFPKGHPADVTAALMTGFRLGNERASLGVEAQYCLTQDLWQELADIPDQSRIMFMASFKF